MCVQCVHGLEVIASALNKTVTEVMEPHKDVLQDMVPPKKHLLRYQALNAQIGLIVSGFNKYVVIIP
jgi:transformation/transcription domain-associated protein